MKSNSDSQSLENCVGFCDEPVTCDPPLRGGYQSQVGNLRLSQVNHR